MKGQPPPNARIRVEADETAIWIVLEKGPKEFPLASFSLSFSAEKARELATIILKAAVDLDSQRKPS